MLLKIPQPDFSRVNKDVILKKLFRTSNVLPTEWKKFEEAQNSPIYKSWNEIKYLQKIPLDMTPEEAFAILQISREFSGKKTPIKDINEKTFIWLELDRFQKFFYNFAKDFGDRKKTETLGEIQKELLRKKTFEGIMEEAIASSQIEGATETRKQAKKLLRSGRKPVTRSEKMIVNNYQTMLKIEQEWRHEEMGEDLLLRIQRSLTQGSIEESDVGRFRKDEDRIFIGPITGEIAFTPPRVEIMQTELANFIDFANEKAPYDGFLWDLARAIMLHFWLAYLHPFCDGNGRTARAVFYWYLLRKNFLHIGFLPISTRIRSSKGQYERAFLLSEQDQNDLTYFFDYIIRQMKFAIQDFEEFGKKTLEEERRKREILKTHKDLNQRQIGLLQFFEKNPDEETTFIRHQRYHGVTYLTAHKDLTALKKKGFLNSNKREKTWYFAPSSKVFKIFQGD